VQVGDTVSLRVRTDTGSTEVVGTVLAASPSALTVRRRNGAVVELDVTQITAGRVVPPSPAQRIPAPELQQVAALGWRALEVEPLGDWLLRAAGGLTGRANSALALGDASVPLAAAITHVERWYGERGLPAQIQQAFGAAPRGLRQVLDDLGWATSSLTHVMTAELGPVLRGADSPSIDIRLDDEPDDAWIAAWRADSGVDAAVARALVTNHPNALFASARDGDRTVAIARASVDGRWVGLFCVEVATASRRSGLGRAVSIGALRAAVQRGARRGYLQLSSDNEPGVALYSALGFAVHHDYVYRSPTNVE
jgi:GNAT superfamily N-acetyltransferase